MHVVLVGSDGAVLKVESRLPVAELARFVHDAAATLPAGNPTPPETVSVTEVVERYLEFKVSLTRSPETRTLRDYQQYLRQHVRPHAFGGLPVATATRAQARQWQNELLVKPKQRGGGTLGANSVIKIRTSLVAPALQWARLPGDNGEPPLRTAPSPFDGLEMPEPTRFRAAVLESTTEIRTFIDLAYQVDPEWADLVLTALCTGFRFGEVTALGPAGLHPQSGDVIALRRFSGGLLLPGTKSGRSQERRVPVPEPVMKMLTQRADGLPPDALLFTTVTGGPWPFSSYWKRWDRLRDLLRRHGIDRHLTGHGLRHSLISALHAGNTGDGLVRRIAGHRDTRMNDHYLHLTAPGREAVTAITTTFLLQ
ncbi:hypothetical protein Val02_57090 [Virgisporangium aliadipatigenens]|uniref:Integrase n=1 Tax=Virgisporangium aliadipatigenens TaxID=741659 RepID=A0A8J4DTD0_9ACTN|nr:tyrosine-type recombinase/integrase [Virgisporangium aliadipatigenens]GIJ48823.1 hypothetical protein Val02_57090 [Virgisporangium aliadipatigenens]